MAVEYVDVWKYAEYLQHYTYGVTDENVCVCMHVCTVKLRLVFVQNLNNLQQRIDSVMQQEVEIWKLMNQNLKQFYTIIFL